MENEIEENAQARRPPVYLHRVPHPVERCEPVAAARMERIEAPKYRARAGAASRVSAPSSPRAQMQARVREDWVAQIFRLIGWRR